MTTAAGVALIVGILSLAFVAAATDHRSALTSRIAKMAAASCVIVLAVATAEWNAYATLVLVALVLSWIGDLALSYSTRRSFVVGLTAFALAHLAYVAAFVARGDLSLQLLVVSGFAMAVFGMGVLKWLSPHRPSSLRWPLTIYVAIICIMVATAFATLGDDPNLLIPVAALLFTASDLFVARQRFVTQSQWNRLIGLPLYFLAQILFALSTT